MIYCTGGSTQYLLGTQRYRLRHGDIVLIPPGVSHRPCWPKKWPIHTGAALYGSARNMWKRPPDVAGAAENQRFGGCCARPTPVGRGMAKLFEAGCGGRPAAHRGWQAVVCATTLELLVNIARALEDVDRPTPPAEVPDLFDRLNLFIEEHLAQDVTLERAAREFFVSKSTIDHCSAKAGHQLLPVSHARAVSSRRRSAFWKGEALGRILHGCGLRRLFHVLPGVPGGNTASPRLISATLTAYDAARTAGTALLCAMEKGRPGWPGARGRRQSRQPRR